IFQHQVSATTDIYYRLAIEDDDRRIKYSSILRLPAGKNIIKIYPTIIQNGLINISISKTAKKLQLVNSHGAVVFEQSLIEFSGSASIRLPILAKGMYVAMIITDDQLVQE